MCDAQSWEYYPVSLLMQQAKELEKCHNKRFDLRCFVNCSWQESLSIVSDQSKQKSKMLAVEHGESPLM
jgi:hypothetical protein